MSKLLDLDNIIRAHTSITLTINLIKISIQDMMDMIPMQPSIPNINISSLTLIYFLNTFIITIWGTITLTRWMKVTPLHTM